MKITLIAALDKNHAIGKNGKLLTHISPDLKRFKKLTTGGYIVMGRKTFESLPNGALPNRTNIVLTKDLSFKPENTIIVNSVEEVLNYMELQDGNPELFVIGGGEIYREFFDMADKLEITHVYFTFSGSDTFFPNWDPCDWLIEEQSDTEIDKYRYQFITYTRK